MRIADTRQQEFCTYTGIAGILITATAIIQHFFLYRVFSHVVPASMLGIYVCSLVSFTALSRQHPLAPLMLAISTSLCLFNGAMAIAGPLFSLLVIIHIVYAATLTVVIYIDDLPRRLRLRRLAILEEEHAWQGKI